MEEIRTDLAAEAHSLNARRGIDDGIIVQEDECCGLKLTRAKILSGEGEAKSGRKAGEYLTLDIGKPWLSGTNERETARKALSALLTELIPDGDAPLLIAGLGNEAVTPDAIGPLTVRGLVVTHHIKRLNAALYTSLGFADVAAICPSVLGQTGIESARLIAAAAECVKPRCIIAVDALAARGLDRLCTTVQLSNAGIAPGSGVGGGREELSAQTMGCTVIGVGVPTVVDARTVAIELGGADPTGFGDFFVAPKETDTVVRTVSALIAAAVNRAVHKDVPDIEEYAPL